MPYKRAEIRAPTLSRAAVTRVAQTALGAMQRRAFDRGLGIDDRPYAPYSRPYARWKRRQVGHSRVDHMLTGAMRRSLRADVRQRRTALGRFSTGHTATISLRAPGVPDYAVYTNRRRPWFGLSRLDRRVVGRAAAAELARAVEGRQ